MSSLKSRQSLGGVSLSGDSLRKSPRRKTIGNFQSSMNANDENAPNNSSSLKRRYSIRSPAVKRDSRVSIQGESEIDLADDTTISNVGRSTANPSDLSELLVDIANESCVSIHSEESIKLSSSSLNQSGGPSDDTIELAQLVAATANTTGTVGHTEQLRRKTFDGNFNAILETSEDEINPAMDQNTALNAGTERRATVDPSDLATMMRELEDSSQNTTVSRRDSSSQQLSVSSASNTNADTSTVRGTAILDTSSVSDGLAIGRSPACKKSRVSVGTPLSQRSTRSRSSTAAMSVADDDDAVAATASVGNTAAAPPRAGKNSSGKKQAKRNTPQASLLSSGGSLPRRSPRFSTLTSTGNDGGAIPTSASRRMDVDLDAASPASALDLMNASSASRSGQKFDRRTTVDANDMESLLETLDTSDASAALPPPAAAAADGNNQEADGDAALNNDDQGRLSMVSSSASVASDVRSTGASSVNTVELLQNVSTMLLDGVEVASATADASQTAEEEDEEEGDGVDQPDSEAEVMDDGQEQAEEEEEEEEAVTTNARDRSHDVSDVSMLSTASTSVNTCNNPRRETADPADFALMLEEMAHGFAEEEKQKTKHLEQQQGACADGHGRAAADQEMVLDGEEEEEVDEGSAVSSGASGFGDFRGRESIETVVLLQSVANTLNELEQEESCMSRSGMNISAACGGATAGTLENGVPAEITISSGAASAGGSNHVAATPAPALLATTTTAAACTTGMSVITLPSAIRSVSIAGPRAAAHAINSSVGAAASVRRETADQADLAALTQELEEEAQAEAERASEQELSIQEKAVVGVDRQSTTAANAIANDAEEEEDQEEEEDDQGTVDPTDVLNDSMSTATNQSIATIATLELIETVQATLQQQQRQEEEDSDGESECTSASLAPLADLIAMTTAAAGETTSAGDTNAASASTIAASAENAVDVREEEEDVSMTASPSITTASAPVLLQGRDDNNIMLLESPSSRSVRNNRSGGGATTITSTSQKGSKSEEKRKPTSAASSAAATVGGGSRRSSSRSAVHRRVSVGASPASDVSTTGDNDGAVAARDVEMSVNSVHGENHTTTTAANLDDSALMPPPSSTLKSCLSSRKLNAESSTAVAVNTRSSMKKLQQAVTHTSIASSSSVSTAEAVSANAAVSVPTSARKNVIFGPPQAAEFHETSPTTSYTPMQKEAAQSFFSMDVVEDTSAAAENNDPVTRENDRILHEWDRLTNMSSETGGSTSDDDENEEMGPKMDVEEDGPEDAAAVNGANGVDLFSPSGSHQSSSSGKKNNKKVMKSNSKNPTPLLTSSTSRRRKSMRQPLIRMDDSYNNMSADSDERLPISPAYMPPEVDLGVYQGAVDMSTSTAGGGMAEQENNSSMTSQGGDVTCTVNLPSNLADLIEQNDSNVIVAGKRDTVTTAVAAAAISTSGVGTPSDSKTQEIEVDLHALMQQMDSSSAQADLLGHSHVSGAEGDSSDGSHRLSILSDSSTHSSSTSASSRVDALGKLIGRSSTSTDVVAATSVDASAAVTGATVPNSSNADSSVNSSFRSAAAASDTSGASDTSTSGTSDTSGASDSARSTRSRSRHQQQSRASESVASAASIGLNDQSREDVTYTLEHSLGGLVAKLSDSPNPSLLSAPGTGAVAGPAGGEISEIMAAGDDDEEGGGGIVRDEMGVVEFSSTPAAAATGAGADVGASVFDDVTVEEEKEEEEEKQQQHHQQQANQLVARLRSLNAGSRSNTLSQMGADVAAPVGTVGGVEAASARSRMSIGMKRLSIRNKTTMMQMQQLSAAKSSQKKKGAMRKSVGFATALASSSDTALDSSSLLLAEGNNMDVSSILPNTGGGAAAADIAVQQEEEEEVVEDKEVSMEEASLLLGVAAPADSNDDFSLVDKEALQHVRVHLFNFFAAVQSVKAVIQSHRSEVQQVVRVHLANTLQSAYVDTLLAAFPLGATADDAAGADEGLGQGDREGLMYAWELAATQSEMFIDSLMQAHTEALLAILPLSSTTATAASSRPYQPALYTARDPDQLWLNMSTASLLRQTAQLKDTANRHHRPGGEVGTTASTAVGATIANGSSSSSLTTTSSSTDRFFSKVLNCDPATTRQDTSKLATQFSSSSLTTTTSTCEVVGSSSRRAEQALHLQRELQETRLLIDIINKLTFCRVTMFQSNCIRVTAMLSPTVSALLVFHISKTSAGELSISYSELDMNWLETPSDPALMQQNLFVSAFFASVMCSDDLNGVLCKACLDSLSHPSDIPALLHKVSGSIGVLRTSLEKLALLSCDGWSFSVMQAATPNTIGTGSHSTMDGPGGISFNIAISVPTTRKRSSSTTANPVEQPTVTIPVRSFVACTLNQSVDCLHMLPSADGVASENGTQQIIERLSF